MRESIRFTLNRIPMTLTVDADRKLPWVLRTDLCLTGTRFGCGESYCGICYLV